MRNEFDWYKWTIKPVAIFVLVMMMLTVFMGGVKANDSCLSAKTYPDLYLSNSKNNGAEVKILERWEYAEARGLYVQLVDESEPPLWFFYAVTSGGLCVDIYKQPFHATEEQADVFITEYIKLINESSV